MTPEHKRLVKKSWDRVFPQQHEVARRFYERLFFAHPEVKTYFRGDMLEQGRKLMAMLDAAVRSLDNLDALTEPLRRSGQAHATYGVTPADYDKVGDALLWTLEKQLGAAFTPADREAWRTVYATVADIMIDGAGSPAS
ncbi:MAG: hemin receptor [Gammaproteobacteria bacterium]|nr:hemin receptor [Gammaproteobacteria bacterium]